jgi:hypothetical protein
VTHEIRVFGFSKNHLVKMADPTEVQMAATPPLHLLVALQHRLTPFDRAIIAFDARPPNQLVPGDCMHDEVDFVLRYFVDCVQLPRPFRDAAAALRGHYARPLEQRPQPRAPLAIEILYMRPKFEALLACDEDTVHRALVGDGVRRPPEWPSFAPNRDPDTQILTEAVACASPAARRKVRGSFKTSKHEWAELILRSARSTSALLQHTIARRLQVIAA